MSRATAPDPTRPPAPWAWAWSGLVAGVLLAVVLFAPARWLASVVGWASDGHVVLEDARGTVWNGSAQGVLAGGRGSRDAVALPSRLVWRVRPGLHGLHVSLTAPCCTSRPVEMSLQPRWRGLTIAVADGAGLHWPAALLAGLGTPWNTLHLEGELQLSTHSLTLQWTLQQLQVAGRAELLALDMRSRLTTLRPMGSYRLTLEGPAPGTAPGTAPGAAPALRLDTLAGSLRITGTGEWHTSGPASRLHFSGEASAAPEHEAVLANLLNLIGRREGARSIITLG